MLHVPDQRLCAQVKPEGNVLGGRCPQFPPNQLGLGSPQRVEHSLLQLCIWSHSVSFPLEAPRLQRERGIQLQQQAPHPLHKAIHSGFSPESRMLLSLHSPCPFSFGGSKPMKRKGWGTQSCSGKRPILQGESERCIMISHDVTALGTGAVCYIPEPDHLW